LFIDNSAYPLLSYLMIPKMNELEGTPSTSSCVEGCIDILKGR